MAQIIQMPRRGEIVDRVEADTEAKSALQQLQVAMTAVMSLAAEASTKLEQLQLCLEIVDFVADECQPSPAQRLLREQARLLSDHLKRAAIKLSDGRQSLTLHHSWLVEGRV